MLHFICANQFSVKFTLNQYLALIQQRTCVDELLAAGQNGRVNQVGQNAIII
jgi:hypothetical protein